MKIKVMDANLLIRFIKECDFFEVFKDWGENGKYKLMITPEVNREIIQNPTRAKLNALIKDNLVQFLPETESTEISRINGLFRVFSPQDCTVYSQCIKNPTFICLTDDNPLRNALIDKKIEVHGTFGIHEKLIKDKQYPVALIEEKMKVILSDPRVNPEIAKQNKKKSQKKTTTKTKSKK